MIIVLSAPRRSGKDEVANILKKYHNYQRIGLADPLKRICAKVFGMSENMFFDDELKDVAFDNSIEMTFDHLDVLADCVEANEIERALLFQHGRGMVFVSPRDILQRVGTELVRLCISDTYWLDLATKTIAKMDGNVVITDARFPNERLALKAIGGLLIRIKRKGYEGSGHASETSIGEDDDYSVIINNDSSLADLQHDILEWYRLRFGYA